MLGSADGLLDGLELGISLGAVWQHRSQAEELPKQQLLPPKPTLYQVSPEGMGFVNVPEQASAGHTSWHKALGAPLGSDVGPSLGDALGACVDTTADAPTSSMTQI